MDAFNPNAKCPKCGGGEIGCAFTPASAAMKPLKMSVPEYGWFGKIKGFKREQIHPGYDARPECLTRHCLTCGYSWPEAPMDGGADV